MEEALRQIDRRIAIPYWDSSLDFELDNPIDSIMWSPPFVGNGDGFVTSGPFANWKSVNGTTLLRNYAAANVSLYSKEIIERICTRCRTWEMSTPTSNIQYNLEFYHGGPHNWVGGNMLLLNTAPNDPLFYMHHSFVDYLWTKFQIQQHTRCHVDPNTDYPPSTGVHAANVPNPGFPQYLAIDGFQTYWASIWYQYELAPFCSRSRPHCGSPYLRCNVKKSRCVTVVRHITAKGPTGEMITAPPSTFKSLTAANAKRAQKETDSVYGPSDPPPPWNPLHPNFCSEERHMRVRRSVQDNSSAKPIIQGSSYSQISHFESKSKVPASNSNGRMSEMFGTFVASATKTFNPITRLSFPFSTPGPLLPLPWGNHSQWHDINTFAMHTSNLHIKEMVYIPIKIIRVAPSGTTEQSTAQSHRSRRPQFRRTCSNTTTGYINVSVHSQGLNYVGSHMNDVIVDSHPQESSAITFIGVKIPSMGTSEVLLSAFDECGNVCKPECISDGSNPVRYHPCTGVLKVTSQDPVMYMETVPDALHGVSEKSMSEVTGSADDIRLIFRCLRS